MNNWMQLCADILCTALLALSIFALFQEESSNVKFKILKTTTKHGTKLVSSRKSRISRKNGCKRNSRTIQSASSSNRKDASLENQMNSHGDPSPIISPIQLSSFMYDLKKSSTGLRQVLESSPYKENVHIINAYSIANGLDLSTNEYACYSQEVQFLQESIGNLQIELGKQKNNMDKLKKDKELLEGQLKFESQLRAEAEETLRLLNLECEKRVKLLENQVQHEKKRNLNLEEKIHILQTKIQIMTSGQYKRQLPFLGSEAVTTTKIFGSLEEDAGCIPSSDHPISYGRSDMPSDSDDAFQVATNIGSSSNENLLFD